MSYVCTQKENNRKRAGFGLVEVVVATAIISGTLYALAAVAHLSFRIVNFNVAKTQAEFLAEEGLEVARIVRDEGWTAGGFATTSEVAVFYPTFTASTSMWALGTTSPGLIDGRFDRTLIVENGYRNASSDIVASTSVGAVLDSGTKFVTSRVVWDVGGNLPTEVVIETYLTNLFSN